MEIGTKEILFIDISFNRKVKYCCFNNKSQTQIIKRNKKKLHHTIVLQHMTCIKTTCKHKMK